MDELLANIRRAITEDTGVADRPASVVRGSMREMRVSLDMEPKAEQPFSGRAQEIRELRDRVSGQMVRKEEVKPPQSDTPPKANGFVGLLTGGAARPPEPLRAVAPEIYAPSEEFAEPAFAAVAREPELRRVMQDEPVFHHERLTPAPWEEDPAPRLQSYSTPLPRASDAPAFLPPYKARAQEPAPARSYAAAEENVMSSGASAAAAQSFQRLAESMMQRAMAERPIEDVTRELLRGMLRQWLDENLPQLVEKIVREEIERVARRGPLRS